METWIDIPNYEGFYKISNLGRIKSIDRIMLKNGKYPVISKGKILKLISHKNGYLFVNLSVNNKRNTIQVHKLMAISFLNHTPCGHKLVVDHINSIKNDNRLINLQLISHRENISKDKKGCSSIYTGVSWNKKNKKWYAMIRVNKKHEFLGVFDCEIKAFKTYQERLKEIS